MKEVFLKDKILSPERKKDLLSFSKPLGLKFKNLELLDLAFHHRSCCNENALHIRYNNERLEFLGDSVLGLVTASYLYTNMMETVEGDMAKIKAIVVSEKTLASVALKLGIENMLILGHGAEVDGSRHKPAILADCMEAIIGAYYLDSGFEEAEKYVLSFIAEEIKNVQNNKGEKDYKSLLQEMCQRKFKTCPIYTLVNKTGPDHDQTFFVTVKYNNVTYGPCSGKSKKDAEQKVAKDVLAELQG